MKILVIGFGKMGMLHAATLRCLADVSTVAVVEPSTWIRRSLKEFHAPFAVYPDPDSALGAHHFDGAVIAAPTAAHAGLLSRMIAAGLPVLVEKPLVSSSIEIAALEKTPGLSKLRAQVSVGHCLRFSPPFAKAAELLRDRVGGRVLGFEARMHSSDVLGRAKGWRFQKRGGSGVLLDLGSHLVDMIRFFFGPPKGVRGNIRSIVSDGVEDAFESDWAYPDFEGRVEASWSRPGVRKATLTVTVRLEDGSLEVSDDGVRVSLRQPSSGLTAGEHRFPITQLENPVEFDLAGPLYTRQDRAWVDSIRGRIPPPNGWDENAVNLRIIDAIRSSDGRLLEIYR